MYIFVTLLNKRMHEARGGNVISMITSLNYELVLPFLAVHWFVLFPLLFGIWSIMQKIMSYNNLHLFSVSLGLVDLVYTCALSCITFATESVQLHSIDNLTVY